MTETAQQQHSFIIEKDGQQIVALVPYEIFLEWHTMLEDWQDWSRPQADVRFVWMATFPQVSNLREGVISRLMSVSSVDFRGFFGTQVETRELFK